MRPILARSINGVTVFIPISVPGKMAAIQCSNDGTIISTPTQDIRGLHQLLVAMHAKAVALNGAVQWLTQLDIGVPALFAKEQGLPTRKTKA